VSRRRAFRVVLLAIAWLATALCQAPPTSGTPQKPYRERLLERALKGDADAQFDLGKNYETGRIGLPQDFSQAQFWYRKAAAQGEPFSEASLAILFNFGKGVQRDYVQAYMWYERAAMHAQSGNRDTIVEMRDELAGKMTPQQIAEARRLAKEWKPAEK
jgi:TPR repeat protein